MKRHPIDFIGVLGLINCERTRSVSAVSDRCCLRELRTVMRGADYQS
jgi:hypothetical protein